MTRDRHEQHEPADEGACLQAFVRSVRLRVSAWIWAEEGLRGLAIALGGSCFLAAAARRWPMPWAAFGVPFALGLWTALRGGFLRSFGRAEAALLLDRVSGAEGEVLTAFEKGDPWLTRRAVARASACRLPPVPRGVPRTLWSTLVCAALLASTPLIPAGQAIAIPKAQEAQAQRLDRAAELAANDPLLGKRLRELARDVRAGNSERVASAMEDLASAVSSAKQRAEAADAVSRAVAQASGGAAEGTGSIEAAARSAVSSPEAMNAMREGIEEGKMKFGEGECPEELTQASRALDARDPQALATALDRFLESSKGLTSEDLARLSARLGALASEAGTATSASPKGGASSAGMGSANATTVPAAVPSVPIDLSTAKTREEALERPTWPRELDPVVKAYFGGSTEVRR